MKKIILIMSLFSSIGFADSFCDGFEAGYKAGYCDGKFSCLEPLTPLCPLPGINESSFQDGYNRGFKNGLFKK